MTEDETRLDTLKMQIEEKQKELQSLKTDIEHQKAYALKMHRDEVAVKRDELVMLMAGITEASGILHDLQKRSQEEHIRWQDLLRKAYKLEERLPG